MAAVHGWMNPNAGILCVMETIMRKSLINFTEIQKGTAGRKKNAQSGEITEGRTRDSNGEARSP